MCIALCRRRIALPPWRPRATARSAAGAFSECTRAASASNSASGKSKGGIPVAGTPFWMKRRNWGGIGLQAAAAGKAGAAVGAARVCSMAAGAPRRKGFRSGGFRALPECEDRVQQNRDREIQLRYSCPSLNPAGLRVWPRCPRKHRACDPETAENSGARAPLPPARSPRR